MTGQAALQLGKLSTVLGDLPNLLGDELLNVGTLRLGTALVQAAYDAMPKRTGKTAASFTWQDESGSLPGSVLRLMLWGSVIAAYIAGGTAAHPIDAHGAPAGGAELRQLQKHRGRRKISLRTQAMALRFLDGDGQVIFRRHVEHPGNKPNDWRIPARDSLIPEVEDVGRRAIQNTVDLLRQAL